MTRTELKDQTFDSLGISPGLLSRLHKLGFEHPTPIQFQAIPAGIEQQDIIGIAQTGSGKTLAFSIPLLQNVSQSKQPALILLPTRELAVQVEETLHKITKGSGLKTALVIGGTNIRPQTRNLKAKPHVIVATPGRLLDHIEQGNVSLHNIGTLVLDEADRMLDMGFAPQLNRILQTVPEDRHTMLFSATMPKEISDMAHDYMQNPLRVEVARQGTTADKIDQEMILATKAEKMPLLERLLKEYDGSVIVFSRTKYGAKKMARHLRNNGFTADEMHSNRSQAQRQKALKAFASGRVRVLVATDIAARGIDVDDIQLVVNFDLPEQLEDYVHRIGRTGRAGKSGKAISFALPEQRRDIQKIERIIGRSIPTTTIDGKPVEALPKAAYVKRRNGRGKPGAGRNRYHSRQRHRRRSRKR